MDSGRLQAIDFEATMYGGFFPIEPDARVKGEMTAYYVFSSWTL